MTKPTRAYQYLFVNARPVRTRTLTAALNRKWLLQDVSHYATVPCVMPPPASTSMDVNVDRTIVMSSSTAPFQHVQARPSRVRMCGLKEIRPGSVLARDVRDVHGTILLRTGTALEPAVIARLRKAAGTVADYTVWVHS